MTDSEWSDRWAGAEGDHWVVEADRYDAMLVAFGEALLDAADLRPGARVLDVGCGNGATAIAAAQRVRPGSVLGVDLSPQMLDVARARAVASGVEGADFLRADAQVHPFDEGSFDAVISRFGVMFFADPDAAFANLARALRAEGHLAFVAWQGLERSEWILVAGMAAAPHIGLPEGLAPDAPGPFGLGDPERTRGILERAGFDEITVDEIVRPMRVGDDPDDAITFMRSIPLVADLFAAATPDQQTAAVRAVREALEPYSGADGVVLHDNAAWLVTARR